MLKYIKKYVYYKCHHSISQAFHSQSKHKIRWFNVMLKLHIKEERYTREGHSLNIPNHVLFDSNSLETQWCDKIH